MHSLQFTLILLDAQKAQFINYLIRKIVEFYYLRNLFNNEYRIFTSNTTKKEVSK